MRTLTLFKEILLEPTSVVLNSFPADPTCVAAAAGDCVGLGRYTTVPAFGLLFIWWIDGLRLGVVDFRSLNKNKQKKKLINFSFKFWELKDYKTYLLLSRVGIVCHQQHILRKGRLRWWWLQSWARWYRWGWAGRQKWTRRWQNSCKKI